MSLPLPAVVKNLLIIDSQVQFLLLFNFKKTRLLGFSRRLPK